MAHPRARLTVFGRQLLVTRVKAGWPAAHVAEQLGISRATAYKWLRRYRAEGDCRARGPRAHDRTARRAAVPDALEAAILAARAEWRYGPDRLGPAARPAAPRPSTGSCARRGFSRLRDADRVTTAPVRYVACHPGALAPPGPQEAGPHPRRRRLAGRSAAGSAPSHGEQRRVRASRGRRRRRQPLRGRRAGRRRDRGAARRARSSSRPPSSPGSASAIERVLTDNGARLSRRTLTATPSPASAARHKRTRPYRPQTNGKAERFIQTLLDEWAYARPYRSNARALGSPPAFVDFYNRGRPHTALGGRSPLDAVNNVPGDHT